MHLKLFDLYQYQNVPVDTLIAHLPSGIVSMEIGAYHYGKTADVLYVLYGNDVFVSIFVKNFQYMDPRLLVNTNTPKQNWQVNLFKKENIAYTVIFNGSTCINGCQNEYNNYCLLK